MTQTPSPKRRAKRAKGTQKPEKGQINTVDKEGQRWLVSEEGYQRDGGKEEITEATAQEEAEGLLSLGTKAFQFATNRCDDLSQTIYELRNELSAEREARAALEQRLATLEQQESPAAAGRSEALTEQQIEAAQMTANLAALASDLDAKSTQHAATGELAEQQIQAAIAATEQPLSELEGRLKAAATVYSEGVIANQGKLAAQELQAKRLDVRLSEAEALIANSQDVMTLASNLGELDRHIREQAAKAAAKYLADHLVAEIHERFVPASPTVDVHTAMAKTPTFAPKPAGNPLGLG